jgi:membrane-bound metal-dependent hydrolase YbcI (DUF457 family)
MHSPIVLLLPLHERAIITSLLFCCIYRKKLQLLHCCVVTFDLLVVELLHSLLQFMVFLLGFLIKKYQKNNRHKKNHLVNFNKLFCACLVQLGSQIGPSLT